MEQNKTSKYFKYAIGEIILVVIGILIALSVNNWNNKRIEKGRAENFIIKMKTQLKDNILSVEENLKISKAHLGVTERLLPIIGANNEVNIDKKIDSLISVNIFDYHLNLNMNSLVEGRENGDLALITSDPLRQSIYQLSTMYERVNERERVANKDLIDLFVPYLNKNHNNRNAEFSFFGRNKEIGESKVYKNDKFKMLEDQEFENLIFNRRMYNENLIYEYTHLLEMLLDMDSLLRN